MTDTQIIQAIIDGKMEAPVMLSALKSFRNKEDSDCQDHVSCVGMKYQAHADFLRVKKTGTAIIMIPDPANIHDSDAVACYVTMPTGEGDGEYTWVRAGYLPKNQTHLLRNREVVYEGKIYAKHHSHWTITAELNRCF